MATHTPLKLAQVQLTASNTTLYTAPGNTTTTITAIYVAETTATARTFRLNHVDSGGSVASTNAIFYDHSIGASRTIKDGAGMILNAGDTIQGLASAAAAVTVTLFGIESVP